MKKIFFVDFDGTITKVDTCVAVMEAFASDAWEEINELWERDELTTEGCANRFFQLMNAEPSDYKRVLEGIEIDDSFLGFLAFCKGWGYPVYVLSDGYDYHIDTVFQKYGIDLPYYANRLRYDKGFQIICTYMNHSCGNCGTCKTTLMEELKREGFEAVYIGDSYSDICPAEHADLVFAKDVLYEYCMKHGIAAIYYENFQDIVLYFINM
ncbi:MAG TPA: phosphoserine phosphatase [Peptococcaceae bacterium]|nr:phosphoserine phosphatase [Peptococcaceae bacterium]